MNFFIDYQENYSRKELLLRTFFGFFYIMIPHGILLFFLQLGLMFVNIGRFWIILFTGKWPKNLFDYAVQLTRYNLRVSARLYNLADGYPQFGLSGTDDKTGFDIEYKETYSRSRLLIRSIFGLFIIVPHIIVLYFKLIVMSLFNFIAWWAILFTGKYPQSLFDFNVGVQRHSLRITHYLYFLSDNYPSFGNDMAEGESGKSNE